MGRCSVERALEIAEGTREDFEELSRFHYRGGRPGVYTAIYTLVDRAASKRKVWSGRAGVIVYTMPTPGLAVRNIATNNYFRNIGNRKAATEFLNANMRCISRVIIEPRYRGLGLAAMLVRETMELVEAPMIEALAVMGQVNPFFEKAGMTAYCGPVPVQCERMRETLEYAGIEEKDMIDPARVAAKIDALERGRGEWLTKQMDEFLEAYGPARKPLSGMERIRMVLGKMGTRPVYYLKVKGETKNFTTKSTKKR